MEREQVLAKLRERIVRFAASHLSRDAAEDLAQEVLLLLHEKYAHLDRVEDLLPLWENETARTNLANSAREQLERQMERERAALEVHDIQGWHLEPEAEPEPR